MESWALAGAEDIMVPREWSELEEENGTLAGVEEMALLR